MKKLNLKVHVVTVTPLMQIEGSEKRKEKLITTVKSRLIAVEGIGLVKIPIYSGNGFRGLLRRCMGEIILEKALAAGIRIQPTDYFLMMSGGGANYQKQELAVVNEVRKLNPLISLLGTSLAVSGKLIVTDLSPLDYQDYLFEYKSKAKNGDDGEDEGITKTTRYGCSLIQTRTFTKKDDIMGQTKYARFMSKEDVAEWEKEMSKTKPETADQESERLTIQSILNAEYVVSGARLEGYISSKEDLSDIEYGLLLRGLANLTAEYLGAGSSNGFGIANYNIYAGDEEIISSLANSGNLLKREISLPESEYEKNCIAAFDKWLNGITEANINVSKLMKSTKVKKAAKNQKAEQEEETEE